MNMQIRQTSKLIPPTLIRAIIFTRSANVLARIFRMARARWTFTVTSLNPSLAAICLFMSPAATLTITSRSRGLGESKCFRNVEFNRRFAAGPILFQGPENRVEQVLATERLGQKVDCSCFHRAHGHLGVAMAGDENDRRVNASSRKFFLNFEATRFGQPHIEHQATRVIRNAIFQESTPRCVEFDF